MKPSANDLFHACQDLVRQGQPVFPCKEAGVKAKAPYTRNGLLDASDDIAQIKKWWQARPEAAIGIPTGIVWDVLDVDTKEGKDGRVYLPYLHGLGLLNGCQFVVRSPSGGWHLYFKAAAGLTNKASALLGLDVRAKGGYVLAPPSWIDDGERSVGPYEYIGETEGATDDPLWWDLIVGAIAPVNTATKKPIEVLGYERRSSLASLRGWLSEREHGERNNALHWAVCRCIDNGIDPHELMDAALLIGLGEEEALLTISSAMRRAGVGSEELLTEAESLFPDNE